MQLRTSRARSRASHAIAIVMLLTTMVLVQACSSGEETTPTPAATTTPQQTSTPIPTPGTTLGAKWTPDGIISAREYSNSEKYGDYEIHWKADDEYIYVGMRARASGFVAVGIQSERRMKNADMVFGFVKDGEVSIFDMFSTGDFGPHPPDTELGGTNDIADFGGKEDGGFTTIEFKRRLITDDEYDNPLSAGKNKIIWSYGSTDSPTLRHSQRGYGELTL